MNTKVLFFLVIASGSLALVFVLSNGKQTKPYDKELNQPKNITSIETERNLPTEALDLPEDVVISIEHMPDSKNATVNLSPASPKEVELSVVNKSTNGPALESPDIKEQTMSPTNEYSTHKDEFITEQRAQIIASEAIGKLEYDQDVGLSIDREAGRYVVTFPVKKPDLQPGEHYRGPPYAAKVFIDDKTGKVLQIKVGS